MPRRRIILLWLLLPLPAILMGLQPPRSSMRGVRIVDVVAAVPEAGGFQPDSIQVEAGEKVLVRFHSADVTHGVAIGPGLGIDLGDVAAGRVKQVELTFDQAGVFTFYCNTWCSPNHWRMRGVIAVNDRAALPPVPQYDPVIDALLAQGVDIDVVADTGHGAGHAIMAANEVETRRPSLARGAALSSRLAVPEELQDRDWRRTHAPQEANVLLAFANPALSQVDLEDVVAHFWTGNDVAPQQGTAAALYAKNCAACHGDTGSGDGFAAGLAPQPPPAFSDPARMAGRRGDVLYAKIRRGGMGTGMPNFGTLFTPEETWALVDYLWMLAFGQPEAGDSEPGRPTEWVP